jgi:hypothetical protein
LKAVEIKPDGFIVFCNVPAFSVYGAKCDYISGVEDGLLTTSDTLGCDSVAIVLGNQNRFKIVDLFGVVGQNCQLGSHDFTFGRAGRLPGYSYPEVKWSPGHWSISRNVAPDPHRWADPATTSSPVSPPVKMPSNKNKNKDKNPVPTLGVFPPSPAPVNSGPSINGVIPPSSAPVQTTPTVESAKGKGAVATPSLAPATTYDSLATPSPTPKGKGGKGLTKSPKAPPTKAPKVTKAPKEGNKAEKGTTDPKSTTLVTSQSAFAENNSSGYRHTTVVSTIVLTMLGGWLFLW